MSEQLEKWVGFAKLIKVNEKDQTVTGVITSEAVDSSGESLDYDSSKPLFEEWSGNIAKSTDGKSVGNVRSMHGAIAAGKLTDIIFDDTAKSITATAKIVDEAEFKKVLEGVYTGFSIGGKYVKKWKADDVTKYTAKPFEVSIVDLPCNPDAVFQITKADGVTEDRKFKPAAALDPELEKQAKTLLKKIDDAEPMLRTVRAAFGQEVMEKGMYGVANLANVLQQLKNCADDAASEAAWEGDGLTVPAQLRDVVKTVGGILCAMAQEETDELTPDDGIVLAMAAQIGDLAKKGAKYSGKTMSNLKNIHDTVAKMVDGAHCMPSKAAGGDLEKAQGELKKTHAVVHETTAALKKLMADKHDLQKRLDAADAKIKELEGQPKPAKGVVTAVNKNAGPDVNPANASEPVIDTEPVKRADGSIDHDATTIKLIKAAHRNPQITAPGGRFN